MADASFFSPYAVGGATRPDSFTNLNPLMQSRLMDMLMAAREELGPDALKITSAYRSPELQAQLYQNALQKYGSPEVARKWVAPAGRSQHNFGTAVDFANPQGQLLRDPNSREAKWLKANAARFGLAVPLSNEPWQVELEGARSGNLGQSTQMTLSTKDATMTPTGTTQADMSGLLAASQAAEEQYKQEQASKPLFQRDTFKDVAGDLAIAFNSMRLNPDDNIVKAVDSIRTQRTEKQARNRTVELMRKAGRDDLAAAAQSGVLTAKEAYVTMLNDAKELRLAQAKGTDTTDYKNYLEFRKTNPNVTFEEFYTKYKNKPDIQNKGVYRDKSGNIIGEVNFDASTGQFFQFDTNGQRQILDMKDLTPVTDATFAKTIPSIKEFGDLSEKLQSDIGSMRQLEKYMTAINNTNEGFARLADDLAASAKTLLSSYLGADYASLAPEELNLRISRGLQQGLIGRFRLETVGGGVMTEQDALRIIQNLGGDVNLLQNKEVVAKQIENLFQAKKSSFERDKKRYDIALDQVYRSQGFEDIEPYKFNEDVFKLKSPVADQSKQTMSDDALLSGAAGKTGPALQQYLEGLSDADFKRLQELM